MTVAVRNVSVPFSVRSVDEAVKPVKEIAKRIGQPTRTDYKSGMFIPKYDGEPVEGFTDYKDEGYVAQLTDPQNDMLAQEITKRFGSQFIPLAPQTSYDKSYSDKNHRKFLEKFWTPNGVLISQEGFVIASPTVEVKDGKFVYSGEKKEVQIKEDDGVIDVLERVGLFKRSKNKVYNGRIRFENGLSSVRSGWLRGGGCFDAGADGPSGWDDDGVSAFELVDPKEKAKLEKPKVRQVDEQEYKEFIEWKNNRTSKPV